MLVLAAVHLALQRAQDSTDFATDLVNSHRQEESMLGSESEVQAVSVRR